MCLCSIAKLLINSLYCRSPSPSLESSILLSCLSVNYCQVGIADSSHRITGWETCHIDCIGGDEDCGGEQIEFGSSGQCLSDMMSKYGKKSTKNRPGKEEG